MFGIGIGERAAWGAFPRAIRNGDLGALQKEPEYLAAKGGDHMAALNLVDRLMTEDTIHQIRACLGDRRPSLVPVLAVESAGVNKIPLAMAEVIADRMGLPVELGIVQREKVGRTGTGADHRLAFNPTFAGAVVPGRDYLILDDTLSMGGTIASLRGYLENRGGRVVGAAVMTAHPGALDLTVKPQMLAAIEQKHGAAMNDYWMETFGYGIDRLTQGEAGHLKAAASVAAIRTRIAAARGGDGERMDAAGTQASARRGQQGVVGSDEPTLDVLKGLAQGLEREQRALVEAATPEQTYQAALAHYVQAKHDQVARIEAKLEGLIEQQEARLQQTVASAPGLLARPARKRAWQQQQAQQQARLHGLHGRLEAVREIRDGMGIHSPRIEELATRKLRQEHPAMAADWDAVCEVERRNEAIKRRGRREGRDGERARVQSLGVSRPDR